jgi:uncharacterized protein
VLNDPLGLTIEDDSAQGEPRWVTMGMSASGKLLVAVWTEREDGERLISGDERVQRSWTLSLNNVLE